MELIESKLRSNGEWRDDERLVVFTEYKTTLDYLTHRLRENSMMTEFSSFMVGWT